MVQKPNANHQKILNYAWKTGKSCLIASCMKSWKTAMSHWNSMIMPGTCLHCVCSTVSIRMLVMPPPGAKIRRAASTSSQSTQWLLDASESADTTSVASSRCVYMSTRSSSKPYYRYAHRVRYVVGQNTGY